MVLEVVIQQKRSAAGCSAARNIQLLIGGHICVLKVGLYDPVALCVGVDHVVETAAILNWSSGVAESGLANIAARNEGQGIGGIKCVSQRSCYPGVTI